MINTANLNRALDRVRQVPTFAGKDPTTVVTIAMLFEILQTEPGPDATSEEREKKSASASGSRTSTGWSAGQEWRPSASVLRDSESDLGITRFHTLARQNVEKNQGGNGPLSHRNRIIRWAERSPAESL